MPTHSKRASLRLNGLVTDDFPFDKRWLDDELALNVMEQLPLNLSMHRIRFVKGSYGALTPINLANDLPLTCETLMRVVGQGCVYAQVVARNNVVGEATLTRSISDKDEIGIENARSDTFQPPVSEEARYDVRENIRSYTVQPSQSITTNSNDIYSTIRTIFPQVPDDTLRACAVDNNEVETAVEAVLNRETSLEQIVHEMKNKVNKESQITITVRRSSIWRDCLAFYKVAMIDKSRLFKEMKIEFEGEEGVDCGALRVEFFQLSIQEAKKALLEEIDESFIPKKTSTSLLAFKMLGVLMGHSLIQDGIGIHCLPEWAYDFLCKEDFQSAAELIFSEKQIPLNAATALLHTLIEELRNADSQDKIDSLLDECTSTGQVNSQIVNGSSWDITTIVTEKNRGELISELIIDELLRKRLGQLTAIRQGLQITGILSYLEKHPRELSPLFAPSEIITCEAVLASLDVPLMETGSIQHSAYMWLQRLIETATEKQLALLLRFTTSLSHLPPTGLSPKVEIVFQTSEDRIYPEAAVCFRQLSLPICHANFEDFNHHFLQALRFESEGFGLM